MSFPCPLLFTAEPVWRSQGGWDWDSPTPQAPQVSFPNLKVSWKPYTPPRESLGSDDQAKSQKVPSADGFVNSLTQTHWRQCSALSLQTIKSSQMFPWIVFLDCMMIPLPSFLCVQGKQSSGLRWHFFLFPLAAMRLVVFSKTNTKFLKAETVHSGCECRWWFSLWFLQVRTLLPTLLIDLRAD